MHSFQNTSSRYYSSSQQGMGAITAQTPNSWSKGYTWRTPGVLEVVDQSKVGAQPGHREYSICVVKEIKSCVKNLTPDQAE